MITFKMVILVIGFGLLILGSCSAYTLFKYAVQFDEAKNEIHILSIWALFFIGLVFGLLFIWFALP